MTSYQSWIDECIQVLQYNVVDSSLLLVVEAPTACIIEFNVNYCTATEEKYWEFDDVH